MEGRAGGHGQSVQYFAARLKKKKKNSVVVDCDIRFTCVWDDAASADWDLWTDLTLNINISCWTNASAPQSGSICLCFMEYIAFVNSRSEKIRIQLLLFTAPYRMAKNAWRPICRFFFGRFHFVVWCSPHPLSVRISWSWFSRPET